MPGANEIFEHVYHHVHAVNPYKFRPAPSRRLITTYRILTPLALIIALVPSIYYTFARPKAGIYSRRTIWAQNEAYPTPFSLNRIIVGIYWLVLYLLQLLYCSTLYTSSSSASSSSSSTDVITAAANLVPPFALHSILLNVFIHMWVRGAFWIAEVMLMLDFANLLVAYLRFPVPFGSSSGVGGGSGGGSSNRNGSLIRTSYNSIINDDDDAATRTSSRLRLLVIHAAALAGPLAFVFVALFWCGAAMLDAHGLGARLFANAAIWLWLVFGGGFLAGSGDWVLGGSVSVLSAALGVHQFLIKVVALQWIFAFVIMAVLFVASLAVAGYDVAAAVANKAASAVDGEATTSGSGETAPLLRGRDAEEA